VIGRDGPGVIGREWTLPSGVDLVENGRPMTRRSHLCALALTSLLGGCAMAGADMVATRGGVDPVLGQTIIFVGTDSTTLQTNIYQVQAVSLRDDVATSSNDGAPAALDADEFEVTPLTDFLESPGSPVQEDGDGLLPTYAPFALPDRLGTRVAVVASGTDVDDVPLGRAAVLELGTRDMQLAPDVRGLIGVRFSWLGNHLLFESEGEAGPELASMAFPLDATLPPTPVAYEGAASIEFGGLVPGADHFLALATDAAGLTTVLSVDPSIETVTPLVAAAAGAFSDFAITDGLVSATRRTAETGRRDIVVASWEIGQTAPSVWANLTGDMDGSCFDAAWAPPVEETTVQRLAYVCEDAVSGRPDVMLWEGEAPPLGTSAPEMDVLTGGAQTAVPDGSMDGLVVRSRLQWDPSGRIVVFGASNADDAFNADAMTLLAVDIDDQRAIPVYDGDNGLADLAHFSSVAPDPVLLVWDRSASGVEDTAGRHAIQLVAADPAGNRTVRGVSLGQNLLVAYPLFLGGNSLFYP